MTAVVIGFFTLAGAACLALVVRAGGQHAGAGHPGGDAEEIDGLRTMIAELVAMKDDQASSSSRAETDELESLRELVLEVRKEVKDARRESELARVKAVSSYVGLQRALGPGGDVEMAVAEQLHDAMSRPSTGRVVSLRRTRRAG